jgi:hypothetical protein
LIGVSLCSARASLLTFFFIFNYFFNFQHNGSQQCQIEMAKFGDACNEVGQALLRAVAKSSEAQM